LPMVPTHSLTGSFAVSAWHLGWLAAVGVRCGEGAQAWASCARLGGVCAYADRFGATITAYGTWLPGRARGRDWSAHDICRSIRSDHHWSCWTAGGQSLGRGCGGVLNAIGHAGEALAGICCEFHCFHVDSPWHLGWLAAAGVRCGEGVRAWASCARLGGVCAYADRSGATITAYMAAGAGARPRLERA
jgi:hypothetical protein